MRRAFVAIRALIYAAVFLSLWGWGALRLREEDVAAGRYLPFAVLLPGVALAACGALLGLTCLVLFVVRGDGTAAPFDPPRRFVATGPFRWVRNPMYVGGIATLAGCGLALRSPSVVALAAGAWGLVHVFVLFVEELGLERRFGESYREYKRVTNRWLPRVPRRR